MKRLLSFIFKLAMLFIWALFVLSIVIDSILIILREDWDWSYLLSSFGNNDDNIFYSWLTYLLLLIVPAAIVLVFSVARLGWKKWWYVPCTLIFTSLLALFCLVSQQWLLMVLVPIFVIGVIYIAYLVNGFVRYNFARDFNHWLFSPFILPEIFRVDNAVVSTNFRRNIAVVDEDYIPCVTEFNSQSNAMELSKNMEMTLEYNDALVDMLPSSATAVSLTTPTLPPLEESYDNTTINAEPDSSFQSPDTLQVDQSLENDNYAQQLDQQFVDLDTPTKKPSIFARIKAWFGFKGNNDAAAANGYQTDENVSLDHDVNADNWQTPEQTNPTQFDAPLPQSTDALLEPTNSDGLYDEGSEHKRSFAEKLKNIFHSNEAIDIDGIVPSKDDELLNDAANESNDAAATSTLPKSIIKTIEEAEMRPEFEFIVPATTDPVVEQLPDPTVIEDTKLPEIEAVKLPEIEYDDEPGDVIETAQQLENSVHVETSAGVETDEDVEAEDVEAEDVTGEADDVLEDTSDHEIIENEDGEEIEVSQPEIEDEDGEEVEAQSETDDEDAEDEAQSESDDEDADDVEVAQPAPVIEEIIIEQPVVLESNVDNISTSEALGDTQIQAFDEMPAKVEPVEVVTVTEIPAEVIADGQPIFDAPAEVSEPKRAKKQKRVAAVQSDEDIEADDDNDDSDDILEDSTDHEMIEDDDEDNNVRETIVDTPFDNLPSKAKRAKDPKYDKTDEIEVVPSRQMAAILGTNAAMPKWKVVSNIWEYLRDNDLLDKVDSRRIYPDEKIKALVPSSMTTGEYITTQQLTRCINNHLAPNDGKKIGGKF